MPLRIEEQYHNYRATVALSTDSISHYNDVIMDAMVSQIISLRSVCSAVYSRRRSKKTSKLCVTGLCVGNSPVTGEFPAQRASNAENVSIWWRHHDDKEFTPVIHNKRSLLQAMAPRVILFTFEILNKWSIRLSILLSFQKSLSHETVYSLKKALSNDAMSLGGVMESQLSVCCVLALTHWPLGDKVATINVYFYTHFTDLTPWAYTIELSACVCHPTSRMVWQRWIRYWLGAAMQHTITCTDVDKIYDVMWSHKVLTSLSSNHRIIFH